MTKAKFIKFYYDNSTNICVGTLFISILMFVSACAGYDFFAIVVYLILAGLLIINCWLSLPKTLSDFSDFKETNNQDLDIVEGYEIETIHLLDGNGSVNDPFKIKDLNLGKKE